MQVIKSRQMEAAGDANQAAPIIRVADFRSPKGSATEAVAITLEPGRLPHSLVAVSRCARLVVRDEGLLEFPAPYLHSASVAVAAPDKARRGDGFELWCVRDYSAGPFCIGGGCPA